MTTVSQIITDAYRESNLIAVGAEPTADEQTEALRLLNRVVIGLFGNEMGDPLEILPFGKGNIQTPDSVPVYMDELTSYYIPGNTRLLCNLEESGEVSLDPNPRDGCRFSVVDASGNLDEKTLTVKGNGRLIESATSIILNTPGLSREWFYRDDLGSWVRLADLELTDESPFPSKFDDLLIGKLSIKIAPRQGISLDPMTQVSLVQAEKKFRAQYKQTVEVPSEQGLLRLPSTKNWGWSGTSTSFNRGLPRW